MEFVDSGMGFPIGLAGGGISDIGRQELGFYGTPVVYVIGVRVGMGR